MLGLNEFGIDLSVTDLFITHFHADHSGLISHLATDSTRVFCSAIDAHRINHGNNWYGMLVCACRNGFPPIYEAVTQHPFFKWCAHNWVNFTYVSEGDKIIAGDYEFKCIAAPGHTPGLLALYEAKRKMLIGGDHLLAKITPNISTLEDNDNPLKDYLNSLDKVYKMDIELVLPAHRAAITDHRERIAQLKEHHQDRAQAIMDILQQGSQNAFEVASQMKWDMSIGWDQFPVQQKWFAHGEVMAHLRYLEEEGRVKSLWLDHQIRYTLI